MGGRLGPGRPLDWDLPALPVQVRLRDGQVLDSSGDRWVLRAHGEKGTAVTLKWDKFRRFTPRALYIAKLVLLGRAGDRASWTSRNEYQTLLRFDRWFSAPSFDWSDYTVDVAEAWLAHCVDRTRNGANDFAILRDVYRYGSQVLRLPDFADEVLGQLVSIRAVGNEKGRAVREGDPTRGQLLPDEIEVIDAALRGGLGTPEQRACVWLCLDLGRNVSQFTLCENRDLTLVDSVQPGGQPARLYQLAVPRQKKRTVGVERRSWPISTELGDLLWSLRREPDRAEAPLLWWLSPTAPTSAFDALLKAWADEVDLRSLRVGAQRVNLNARRFRDTMLTNAANEGASIEHLATLADHSDTQSVMGYVNSSPHFLERFRHKVDAIYDPLVKRFRGELVPEEEGRRRGLPLIPGVATQLPGLHLPGIGVCGSQSLCKLAPPLTCYPCHHFVAFRESDHRAVEQALVQYMATLDERVALQIAPSLAAVREVIRAQGSLGRGEQPADGGR